MHASIPSRTQLSTASAAETETARAFLQAYEENTRGSGLYADWKEARRLLDLFMLEKAFYELRYELDNRPTWVRIPLHGILELVAVA